MRGVGWWRWIRRLSSARMSLGQLQIELGQMALDFARLFAGWPGTPRSGKSKAVCLDGEKEGIKWTIQPCQAVPD